MSMPYPNVTSLYKYRAFSAETLEGLRNHKIWFAQPSSFTDPFDSSADNYKTAVTEKTINLLVQEGAARLKELDLNDSNAISNLTRLLYDNFLNLAMTFGVLSLTENCESTLMWSHYADGHRGFCMEFERSETSQLAVYESTRPVIYARHCPLVDLNNLWDQTDVSAFGHELMKMLLVKADEWSYEREWRVLSRPGGRLEDYPGRLISLIWGLRMSEDDKAAVRSVLENDLSVIFRQATRTSGEFRIAIEPE